MLVVYYDKQSGDIRGWGGYDPVSFPDFGFVPASEELVADFESGRQRPRLWRVDIERQELRPVHDLFKTGDGKFVEVREDWPDEGVLITLHPHNIVSIGVAPKFQGGDYSTSREPLIFYFTKPGDPTTVYAKLRVESHQIFGPRMPRFHVEMPEDVAVHTNRVFAHYRLQRSEQVIGIFPVAPGQRINQTTRLTIAKTMRPGLNLAYRGQTLTATIVPGGVLHHFERDAWEVILSHPLDPMFRYATAVFDYHKLIRTGCDVVKVGKLPNDFVATGYPIFNQMTLTRKNA